MKKKEEMKTRTSENKKIQKREEMKTRRSEKT